MLVVGCAVGDRALEGVELQAAASPGTSCSSGRPAGSPSATATCSLARRALPDRDRLAVGLASPVTARECARRARSRPSGRVTVSAVASRATSVLSPIDDGKYAFFAATRSSALSSPAPSTRDVVEVVVGVVVGGLLLVGASTGIRKPVRYQLDGRTRRGSISCASS